MRGISLTKREHHDLPTPIADPVCYALGAILHHLTVEIQFGNTDGYTEMHVVLFPVWIGDEDGFFDRAWTAIELNPWLRDFSRPHSQFAFR